MKQVLLCLFLALSAASAAAAKPSFPEYSLLTEPTEADYEWDTDDELVVRRILAEHAGSGSEPVICGNSSSPLTVTISGPRSNTTCTASLSLSDSGADSCEEVGKVFGEDCDVFLGGLYINIAFLNPASTLEPNVQAKLEVLGLGNITQVGLLHVSLGGSGVRHLATLDFLPKLTSIIGANNPNPANGFTGSALYILGSSGLDIASMPAFSSLRSINGTTILTNLALTNFTNGLQNLQTIEGDLAVQNSPNLTSFAGIAQSVTTIKGQLYVANNPQLVSFAGPNVTTAKGGTLKFVGGQMTIGNNPNLLSLAGLENLETINGSLTIQQNTQLNNITALSKFAKCSTNSTDQTTPNPVFIEVILNTQPGAPPITCIMNTYVAICSFIKNNFCPNPDGTDAFGGDLGFSSGSFD